MSVVPDIAVVLPPKERFTAAGAGAVSLCVRDTAACSRFRARLVVLGVPVDDPFDDVAFTGLALGPWRLLGRNRGFALAVARHLRRRRVALVEVHNRPRIAAILAHVLRPTPVAVHLHNDPPTIGGLATPAQRRAVLGRVAMVVAVSDFVRGRFLERVDDPEGKVRRIYNGVPIAPPSAGPRRREILFVGRLVADKGVAHLASALEAVLPTRPDWSARFIGGAWFGSREVAPFEQAIRERVARFGERVTFEGFRPHDEVRAAMAAAAIVAVPTLVDEAFARVAAEAMAAGAAVVAYPSGGLAEIARGRALVTADKDEAQLAAALARLMDDPALLAQVQARGLADFPFTPERAAAALDDAREDLLRSPS